MKRNIVAAAVLCAVAIQGVPCGAIEINQSYYQDEKVHISGTAEGKLDALTLQMYKEDSQINKDAIENGTAFEKILFTDVDGKFSDTINFGDWLKGGKYTVRVLGEGTPANASLMYINKKESEKILQQELNGTGSISEFAEKLEKNVESLGITNEEYLQKKTVYDYYLYNHMPQNGYTLDNFVKNRWYASFIHDLKNTDTKLDVLIQNYEMYLDAELVKELKSVSDSVMITLREYMVSEDYTVTEFTAALKQNLLVSKLLYCERYTQMQEVIENKLSELDFDLTDYDKVNDKVAVYKNMYADKSGIKDYESARKVFEQAAENALSEQSDKKSSSSSGGSSGGSYTYQEQTGASNTTGGQTTASGTTSSGNLFSDLDGHWAKEYIKQLSSYGVISGYDDQTFRPDNSVTRAEFTKMVTSLFKMSGVAGVAPFADVAADAWYAPAVAAALEKGVVSGDGNYFRPNDKLTRQDAAVIISRAAKQAGIDLSGTENKDYMDSNEISDYAKEAISEMSSSGILNGDGGYFRPLESTTRAETAVMLVRLMKMSSDTASTVVQSVSAGNGERVTTLMERLGLNDMVSSSEGTVSRLEFTVTLMSFLGEAEQATSSAIFQDVSGANSGIIDAAAERGIIPKQDYFKPDEPILYKDALKMCLAAAGYGDMLIAMGNETSQLLKISENLNLTRNLGGVSVQNALSADRALNLIYNTITADMMELVSTGSENNYQTVKGKNILSEYFDIHMIEGIVTANSRTGLNSKDANAGTDRIKIGSDIYYANHDEAELLGYNVEAFIQESEGSAQALIAAFGYRTSIQSVKGVDINGFENNTLLVDRGNGRERKVKLSNSYDLIFNGKALEDSLSDKLLEDCSELILIDNDNDVGKYEVAVIKKATYLQAGLVDALNGIVHDDSLYQNPLKLGDEDCEYIIYDAQGNEIPMYNIESGSVLEAYVSNDGKYAEVHICGETVNGVVQSFDSTEKIITISDTEYDMAGAFAEKYTGIGAGAEVDVYLDRNGRVIFFRDGGSGMRYGYVMRQYKGEDELQFYIKLLKDDNKIAEAEFNDKVSVDGKTLSCEEAYDTLETARTISNLIRYTINKDNKILKIDTAENDNRGNEAIGFVAPEELNASDRLTLYGFDGDKNFSSYTYRYGTGILSPKAKISQSKVFIVPTNYSKTDDDYEVTSSSFFYDGQSINKSQIQIFDINKDGSAGAILYFGAARNLSANNTQISVVSKLYKTVNDDGEMCTGVEVYTNGESKNLYLDTGINMRNVKASGNDLCVGDIVRISEVNGVIKDIIVEFDASADVMGKNSNSSITFNNYSPINPQFQSGKVYSVNDKSIYITPQPAGSVFKNDSFKFAFNTLRQFSTGNQFIKVTMTYSEDGTGNPVIENAHVEPCELSEINTYQTSAEEADFVVLEQRYHDTRACIVYHIERG